MSSPVPREDEALRQFLDAAFDEEVALSPQTRASLGIAGDQDRLDDKSDAAGLRRVRLLESQRDAMRHRFLADALGPEGRLNAALFEARAERARAEHTWRDHIAPFSIDGGPDESASFLIGRHGIGSVEDARHYIARLRELERVLGELAQRLARQQDLGITWTERQIGRLRLALRPYRAGAPFEPGADGPLLADFRKKIAALGLTSGEEAALVAEATAALTGEVCRGRDRYLSAIDAIAPRPRPRDGVWSLPDGDAYYGAALRRWSTTDMSADEIHRLGLEQVEHIGAEMAEVLRQVGFTGPLSHFQETIRTDPRFQYSDDEPGRAQCLRDTEQALAAALAVSPGFFRSLPKASIEVRAVEEWRAANSPVAFYDPASPDGERPGTLYVNLADMTQVQKIQLAAIVHHEGVPGHHYQVALDQECADLPKFRRFNVDYGAYVEGWALYSERLGDEMGLYEDPYARFGMLSLQMWRACRLVLDTGIHAKRWTREQAIAYFTANSSLSHLDIEREVDRYIGSPGQATAYLIGQIRILDLRTRAKDALGPDFDIRDFHDAVLGNGAVPLDVLARQVDGWIQEARHHA
ncbi:DUF885 domain-containing protein [Streptomyces sp. NPDC002680]|uniref:DUF885 domain-containing protein n=1 Tax=Streptomyces sp. NPDC002680 TaxID=3364659 RepID=UPI003682C050